MTTHMLLDTSSLVYRAYFAVPKSITDDAGRPVNAVRGFMDMTARLKTEKGADVVVAVFDADWRPDFRVAAYSGYKKDRPDEPEELTRQFEVLADMLDAVGMPRVAAPGHEADDAIATLCRGIEREDRAKVVTGDRDLLCLVRDPLVSLLFTVRGVSKVDEFDEAAVAERYGVPPRLYSEFAMLRGDPSDGLPGVKGVGPKTAVKLLAEHGSIEGIYGSLGSLSDRLRKAFEDAKDYLEAMKLVVPPVEDASLTTTDPGATDERVAMTLAAEHNLDGPTARLMKALAA